MQAKPFTPRPYQKAMIAHILGNPRCALWAGMGMGKTCATLTALDMLELIEPGATLVLAPLRVAESTWPDEVKKWAHLKHVVVSAVVGSAAQRKAALRTPANIYTMNYDNLPWLVEHFGEDWPFEKVVQDESTRVKSFRLRQGGVRAQALGKIAHSKIKRVIQLTGTPTPNGLLDLWGQVWFLDKGQRLGRSYKAFTDRWFRAVRVGDDPHAVRYTPLPLAQEQIEDRLRDVCLSMRAEDYFDLQAPIVNVIRIELPKSVRSMYREMEREMFLALDCGAEVEAVNAASRTMKCLQIANGALYTDDEGAWTELHSEKIKALGSVIEEAAGMPVLVAYHFKSDLVRLLKAFPKGKALGREAQTLRDWNAGEIPVLFAHPASAGHGLNLQDGGNILVFFGHWWDLEQYQQIVERIGPTRQKQSGHNRPVFIHHIVAAGTVDEVVMERRESKRGVQDLLLDAMRRRQL